ncbi:hypothetical protein PR048_001904 [Dryococelus australis]|uniref:Integrase zinc-binding domain-containing protein n=1 Tax=Dryococelus australis TaxID=614101 RepID=A0ABQ9IK50_9NEOP|nr:hypothetical protein PR048_001904 [Dryococelus australis]
MTRQWHGFATAVHSYHTTAASTLALDHQAGQLSVGHYKITQAGGDSPPAATAVVTGSVHFVTAARRWENMLIDAIHNADAEDTELKRKGRADNAGIELREDWSTIRQIKAKFEKHQMEVGKRLTQQAIEVTETVTTQVLKEMETRNTIISKTAVMKIQITKNEEAIDKIGREVEENAGLLFKVTASTSRSPGSNMADKMSEGTNMADVCKHPTQPRLPAIVPLFWASLSQEAGLAIIGWRDALHWKVSNPRPPTSERGSGSLKGRLSLIDSLGSCPSTGRKHLNIHNLANTIQDQLLQFRVLQQSQANITFATHFAQVPSSQSGLHQLPPCRKASTYIPRFCLAKEQMVQTACSLKRPTRKGRVTKVAVTVSAKEAKEKGEGLGGSPVLQSTASSAACPATSSAPPPPTPPSPAALRHADVAGGLLEVGEGTLQHGTRALCRRESSRPPLLLLLHEHGLLRRHHWPAALKLDVNQDIQSRPDSRGIQRTQWNSLALNNAVLYRNWESSDGKHMHLQLVLPKCRILDVLKELHNTAAGGHFGLNKTLVKRMLRSGAICVMSVQQGRFQGLRDNVLTERENLLLLVKQDFFTKWSEVIPVPNQEFGTVADALVQHIFSRFGDYSITFSVRWDGQEAQPYPGTVIWLSLWKTINRIGTPRYSYFSQSSVSQSMRQHRISCGKSSHLGICMLTTTELVNIHEFVWWHLKSQQTAGVVLQPPTTERICPRLQKCWEGLYRILKQINDVVYCISRQNSWVKHKVVQIDQLVLYEDPEVFIYNFSGSPPIGFGSVSFLQLCELSKPALVLKVQERGGGVGSVRDTGDANTSI